MNSEKKNTFAVDVESSQENKLEEILTEESARQIFPNCSEEIYKLIIGYSIDHAWDVFIELGNRLATPEAIELAKDLKDANEHYFSNGKEYYHQIIKIYKKHKLENLNPYKKHMEEIQKFIE